VHSSLRGISIEDVERLTTSNARRLFGLQTETDGCIAYPIRDNLYLNITNRCSSACAFCVRLHADYVKGHKLRLEREPSAEDLKAAIGNPRCYAEIVFCGYGEPLIRFDVVKEVAAWVKQQGGMVRINTNGHGNQINGRDILAELRGLVDIFSVSMNAHDEETYERICRPSFPGAFETVKDFIRCAARCYPEVRASVVAVRGVDVEACRRLAQHLGAHLKVRDFDVAS
jgi:TatD DNase family protein